MVPDTPAGGEVTKRWRVGCDWGVGEHKLFIGLCKCYVLAMTFCPKELPTKVSCECGFGIKPSN